VGEVGLYHVHGAGLEPLRRLSSTLHSGAAHRTAAA